MVRLSAHRDKGTGVTQIAKDGDAPAILGGASLAYLIHVQTQRADSPAEKEWEWVVHAFGQHGPQLAEQLAATVRAWDRDVRTNDGKQSDPVLTVHPASTPPDGQLPAGGMSWTSPPTAASCSSGRAVCLHRRPGRTKDMGAGAEARRTGTACYVRHT